MTTPRRTTGRTQQAAKTETRPENPRFVTTPAEKNKMAWKIEIELPSGGTISTIHRCLYTDWFCHRYIGSRYCSWHYCSNNWNCLNLQDNQGL